METTELTQPLIGEATLELVHASPGKRFANYLIDFICFMLLFVFWGVILAIVAPAAIDSVDTTDDLSSRLLSMLMYAIFTGFIELIFRGKSIGKFITGTKAVNVADGTDISFTTALARGLCRIVPFEPISALGNPSSPWHDRWTNTIVIDEKLTYPKM